MDNTRCRSCGRPVGMRHTSDCPAGPGRVSLLNTDEAYRRVRQPVAVDSETIDGDPATRVRLSFSILAF